MNPQVQESRTTNGHAETTQASGLESAEAAEDIAALYTWANLHGAKFRNISAVRCEDGSPTQSSPTHSSSTHSPSTHSSSTHKGSQEHHPATKSHNGTAHAEVDASLHAATANGHVRDDEAAGETHHPGFSVNGDGRTLETMLVLAEANGHSKETTVCQDAQDLPSDEPHAIAQASAAWREAVLRNPAEWIPGWNAEGWDAEWYKQGIVDWRTPYQRAKSTAASLSHQAAPEQTLEALIALNQIEQMNQMQQLDEMEQLDQMEQQPGTDVDAAMNAAAVMEPLSVEDATQAEPTDPVITVADNAAEEAPMESGSDSEADSVPNVDASGDNGADIATGADPYSTAADLPAPVTSDSPPWPLPKPEMRWYADAANPPATPLAAAADEQGWVQEVRAQESRLQESRMREHVVPPNRPQWLYESEIVITEARMATPETSSPAVSPVPFPLPSAPPSRSPMTDTLQQSRERLASRWFALKGVFDGPNPEQMEAQPVRHKEPRPPVLALFSLAGGVGKTSTVATLGRALASLGEKTLLTDTTSYGLLPFYFGARELRPGAMRTFTPPGGSTDAPIQLINFDVENKPADVPMPPEGQDWLIEEILRRSRGTTRVVVDMATASAALMRRILQMGPVVLVPVSPDLNSVISLPTAEQFFQHQTGADGMPVKVYYLLNQFDAAQPLHLDVREVLRQQLGERLLPFVLRRSTAVSEALAEGMTVMDYAPNSPVAEDYLTLATWVRNTSAPASAGFRGVRWSEQP